MTKGKRDKQMAGFEFPKGRRIYEKKKGVAIWIWDGASMGLNSPVQKQTQIKRISEGG
jgi:hypothetical protein